MKRLALVAAVLAAFTSLLGAQGGDPAYKPKRINKMIELLEAGKPVYDVSVQGVGYEEGRLVRSIPPTPTPAMFKRSLGAVKPWPST